MIDGENTDYLKPINEIMDSIQQTLGRVGMELTFLDMQVILLSLCTLTVILLAWKVSGVKKWTGIVINTLIIALIVTRWFVPSKLPPELANELSKCCKGSDGNSLYLLPYEIDGIDKDKFKDHIHRLLIVHLSTNSSTAIPSYVGLNELGTKGERAINSLESTNTDLLLAVGDYIGALGMLGIDSEVVDRELKIQSMYLVVPRLDKSQARAIYIDDVYPLTSGAKAREWNSAWKHNTVLALALKEYIRAKREEDTRSMTAIRDYLRIEKRSLPKGDDQLHEVFSRMIEEINQEVGA